MFTALFYPYIAHVRTAKNLILSVRSFCLKDRHRSQSEGSLKSEKSDWVISKSDAPSSENYQCNALFLDNLAELGACYFNFLKY